uniref:Uncharacterized protein n=1 Tax=Amphimedon queenslandica TaxID=400682 RepID=A0A1X7VXX0_AMPQE
MVRVFMLCKIFERIPGGCGLNIFFLCSIFILSVAIHITQPRIFMPDPGLLPKITGSGLISVLVMTVLLPVLVVATALWVNVYLSNNKQLQKLRGNHKDESEGFIVLCCDQCCPDATEAQEIDDKDTDTDVKESKMKVADDETEHVTYSYSFFHFMMVISILFVKIQLTIWYK